MVQQCVQQFVTWATALLCGRRARSGSVAVLTALVFVVLMGFAALGVDVTGWENGRLRAQGAADAAALAAGLAATNAESPAQDALAVAAFDGFVNGTGGATVTVNQPPASGNYTTDSSAIEVIVSQTQQGIFSPFFLATAPTVTGRAVVSASAGACVMILGSSGMSVSGTTNFDIPNCNFYNNGSTNSSGATTITANSIYLAHKPSASGTFTHTATTYQTNASPISNPYASRTIPSYSSCTWNSVSPSSPATFTTGSSPTVLCNALSLSGSGTLTFNGGTSGGVFILKGSLNVSGSWTINVTNATLIFVGSAGISGSGGETFNVTAPTSGATAGIGIWVSGSGGMNFSGSTTFNLTGAIYMPSGLLNTSGMTGTGLSASTCGQLVIGSMNGSGGFGFAHNCASTGISDVGGLALVE